MHFRLARVQVGLLETAAKLWARRRKVNDFFAVFTTFELKEHLRLALRETVSLFPLDLTVYLDFTSGNTEGLGETKLSVSLGASH